MQCQSVIVTILFDLLVARAIVQHFYYPYCPFAGVTNKSEVQHLAVPSEPYAGMLNCGPDGGPGSVNNG